MPYELKDVRFRYTPVITGKVDKFGSRVLEDPERLQFGIQLPSQGPKMMHVRVTVFDHGDLVVNSSDCVRVEGLPIIKCNHMDIMCFGKDVEVLNRWVSIKDIRKAEKLAADKT